MSVPSFPLRGLTAFFLFAAGYTLAGLPVSLVEQLDAAPETISPPVREKLRDGVERAIERLGTGFLKSPRTGPALRARFASGEYSERAYYRELLRLIYRLLFLMVAEERRLIADPHGDDGAYARYEEYFALARLRDLTERTGAVRTTAAHYADLWPGLVQTFGFFRDSEAARLAGADAFKVFAEH